MAAQQTFAFLTTDDAADSTAAYPQTAHSQTSNSQANNSQTSIASRQRRTVTPPHHALAKAPTATSPAKSPAKSTDRETVLRQLRTQVGCVSLAPNDHRERFSTGGQVIDDLLPSGGLNDNALTEWVTDSNSSGAAVLSMITAAVQLRRRSVTGSLVMVDIDGDFYPPAAIALGVPANRIILLRPENHADAVWAIDQALRCDAIAAVWSHLGSRLDDRDARRLQLAAETGNTPGLFVRPIAVRGRPSFADVRFHVTQMPEKYQPTFQPGSHSNQLIAQVTLDRCRGGNVGDSVWVQVDEHARIRSINHPRELSTTIHHETAVVHLADQLAHPASAQFNSQPTKSGQQRRA